MPTDAKRAVQEIDDALKRFAEVKGRARLQDLSDLPHEQQEEIASIMLSTAQRWSPSGSVYEIRMKKSVDQFWHLPHKFNVSLPGFLKALREDYDAGKLRSVSELIRAEVFSDLLDVADVLAKEGPPDPPAMVAGSVMESHLRKLCAKHGIPDVNPDGKTKKLDTLGQDLARVEAISKTDQKSITAWAGIRNDVDHGHFNKYTAQQVSIMLQGIRDFIARNPA